MVKRAFRKLRAGFRRRGIFKRRRMGKPIGRRLKSSVLGSTMTRVIETTYTVFWRGINTTITGLTPDLYLAEPSFETAADSTSRDLMISIVNTPEFLQLAKTWGLFRVKGVKLRYTGVVTPYVNQGYTTHQGGALAFVVQNRISPSASATWYVDNALRVQSMGTNYGMSNSKYFKSPLRSINGPVNKFSYNDWLSTAPNVVSNSGDSVLYLNMGAPFSADANPNGFSTAANGRYYLGKITVQTYIEMAQPISVPV